MKHKIGAIVSSSAILASVLITGTAMAATTTPPGMMTHGARPQGVFGTVSAINGATLTVTSKGFGKNPTPATYTVDASGAIVDKNGTASSLSSVAVGDMVMAQGTVSGTSVTATTIRDGMPQGGMRGRGPMGGKDATSTPPAMQGNGEPVVGGTVSAISGTTLTLTNKSNVTYTVDASAATITKSNTASTLAGIAVGDEVVVQGTVNGNSVTAASVMDQGAPKTGTASSGGKGMGGVMGAIGGFFHNLFGFF